MKIIKRFRKGTNKSFTQGWNRSQIIYELIQNDSQRQGRSSELPLPCQNFEVSDLISNAML